VPLAKNPIAQFKSKVSRVVSEDPYNIELSIDKFPAD
jgi:hypothetical protein